MRTSLIAVAVVLIGATAMAAPQTGTKPAAKPAATKPAAAPKAPAMKSAHAVGTVEKFDAATKTLTVKVKAKDESFVIGDKTSVMKGKDKIDASALAAGSMVKIEYMAIAHVVGPETFATPPCATYPAAPTMKLTGPSPTK